VALIDKERDRPIRIALRPWGGIASRPSESNQASPINCVSKNVLFSPPDSSGDWPASCFGHCASAGVQGLPAASWPWRWSRSHCFPGSGPSLLRTSTAQAAENSRSATDLPPAQTAPPSPAELRPRDRSRSALQDADWRRINRREAAGRGQGRGRQELRPGGRRDAVHTAARRRMIWAALCTR
jgi:hypothetical protein